jgi:hypothetical protein
MFARAWALGFDAPPQPANATAMSNSSAILT